MPFALVFVGLVLIVTGARDTYRQLGSMIVGDMTGARGGAGFIMFAAAIGGVGALGAIPELRTFSHYFMALILISLVLHNSGAAQKILAALKGATAATPVPAASSAGLGTSSAGGTTAGFGSGAIQIRNPSVPGSLFQ
jgi:hypothetical protein